MELVPVRETRSVRVAQYTMLAGAATVASSARVAPYAIVTP
jgi:hypothetical protein